VNICQEYEAEINNSHAKFFPVMDQTSLVWRKKIKALEKVKPQAPEYTLMTTAKYFVTPQKFWFWDVTRKH
jgi:hypothetical protein